MNTQINTRCFNFGYDAEGLRRANTYSNKKGYTAMGGTTDPNVIMNLQNGEVDVVVLNGNRSAQSTWAVYIPMKKHLESMGIACEMNIESYNNLNNSTMEAQESIQQEASVDPIASASSEQAVIAQTETEDEQSQSSNNEVEASVEPKAETAGSSNVSLSVDGEQVDLSPELLATVLGFLKKGVKTKMSVVVSYQAAKKDIQLVFIRGNRNIYPAQVERLWKDIANKPVKKFTRPCAVVSAKTVLENNPGIKLFDLYDKEVTLSTPGIEKMYAIVDGQNRFFAVMAHPEADVDLEILDYTGDVLELIKIFNTNSKNWDTNDFLNSNIEVGKADGGLKAKMAEIQKVIKASDKAAAYLATFKRDAVKKSDVVKGKDSSGYDDYKGERGLRLAMALSYKFGHVDPIKIELVDAILSVYDSLNDMEKGSFTGIMVGCIAEMDFVTKTSIDVSMKAKDYGKVGQTLLEAFKAHAKLHETDLLTHIAKVHANVEQAVKADIAADPVKSKSSASSSLSPSKIYKAQLYCKLVQTQEGRDSKELKKENLEAKFKEKDAKGTKTLKDRTKLAELKKKIDDLQDQIDMDDNQMAEIDEEFKLFE